MTAPAIPQNAPVAPLDTDGPFSIDNAIASISQAAVAQTMAEQAPDPATPARGPDGKFVAKAETPSPDPSAAPAPSDPAAPLPTAPDGTTPTDPAAAVPPLELPEGFVAVPPVEGRELATKFRVLDHEGELEVPDFTIEFTANGKQRSEPLDKVVRLAERGVYNEEREQAVVQARQDAQAIQRQNSELLAYAQRLQADREHLLSSDDAYLNARAQWEAQHTPEARALVAQQQTEQANRQLAFSQARQVTNQYFEHRVLPAVDTIAQRVPTVTPDEIGARLVLMTNHLRIATPEGDTMIPPARHQDVSDIIVRDIVPWAQALHDERDHASQSQRSAADEGRKAAEAKARQAQIEAQRARSQVGRATKPGRAGSPAGPGTREAVPKKPITNIDEAQDAALDATFEALGLERPRGS